MPGISLCARFASKFKEYDLLKHSVRPTTLQANAFSLSSHFDPGRSAFSFFMFRTFSDYLSTIQPSWPRLTSLAPHGLPWEQYLRLPIGERMICLEFGPSATLLVDRGFVASPQRVMPRRHRLVLHNRSEELIRVRWSEAVWFVARKNSWLASPIHFEPGNNWALEPNASAQVIVDFAEASTDAVSMSCDYPRGPGPGFQWLPVLPCILRDPTFHPTRETWPLKTVQPISNQSKP